MSVIYTADWYEDLKQMINGSQEFADVAPARRVCMAIEVLGDETSPYVGSGDAVFYQLELDGGRVTQLEATGDKPPGNGLDFRFTAPATLWESIAAGLVDPITAGLRGTIRIRGDMRFLMQNADAVKLLVDLYSHQVHTEWPRGRPPYAPA